jgi:hypothetical protein
VKLERLLERQHEWSRRLAAEKLGPSTVPSMAAQHNHAEGEAELASTDTLKVEDQVAGSRNSTTAPGNIAEHIRLCSICNGAVLQQRPDNQANGSDYPRTPTTPFATTNPDSKYVSGYA